MLSGYKGNNFKNIIEPIKNIKNLLKNITNISKHIHVRESNIGSPESSPEFRVQRLEAWVKSPESSV